MITLEKISLETGCNSNSGDGDYAIQLDGCVYALPLADHYTLLDYVNVDYWEQGDVICPA